jgi:hydrophobic/amphiphilic exporter-1 (mainly G- bacteria), HAE1 family
VLGGMLAATMLAVFVVPVLFVTIARLAYGRKTPAEPGTEGDPHHP